MSEMANAILDAAERRIRQGGYEAFSFREIAADVGVKSSSVHYHFPTKDDLAAAVIRRYTDLVVEHLDEALTKTSDPIKVWTEALGGTVHSKDRMCPATLLGAAAQDLPPKVALEVRRFFQMHLDKLAELGLSPGAAAELISTLMGAMVVATALGEPSCYDRATAELVGKAAA